jgi:hypothetical protein
MNEDEKKIEEVAKEIQKILDKYDMALEVTVQHTPVVRIVPKSEKK